MTRCRLPRDEDLIVLGTLRNDLPTQYALLADPQVGLHDTASVKAWVDRRVRDDFGIFRVIADEDDCAVGFVQIVDIDRRSRHGSIGVAVLAEERGKGHAESAMLAMFALAVDSERLDKLVLQVRDDNPARKLYEKLGFREVGILARHYRGPDSWHDVVVMERPLREEP